jgi:hypothetical protein
MGYSQPRAGRAGGFYVSMPPSSPPAPHLHPRHSFTFSPFLAQDAAGDEDGLQSREVIEREFEAILARCDAASAAAAQLAEDSEFNA